MEAQNREIKRLCEVTVTFEVRLLKRRKRRAPSAPLNSSAHSLGFELLGRVFQMAQAVWIAPAPRCV
jgi:hypothetical protein